MHKQNAGAVINGTSPPRLQAAGNTLRLRPMRIARVFLQTLLIVVFHHPAIASTKLGVSPKGITIENGSTGKLTFAPQTFTRKTGGEKPLVTTAGNQVEARYASGALMKLQTSGDRILCRYEGLPADGQSFKFSMTLPIRIKEGGKFAFDEAEPGPFPAEKGEQFVQRGNARGFSFCNAQGDGFTLRGPFGYKYLQDNRTFGTQTFSYSVKVDIGGKREGEFAFEVKPFSGSTTTSAASSVKGGPQVDRFGQSAAKQFPGKVESEAELLADAAEQLTESADPRLDQYGGLAGSSAKHHLAKTGFFHVEDLDGRKVLADPEGNLFFQLGVCGINNTDDYTVVKGREKSYEWLPEKGSVFDSAWREEPGSGVFSFYLANWIRKYGKPFDREEWSGQVVRRLRSWGFNSAGAFSMNTETMKNLQFPRVTFLPLDEKSGLPVLPDKIGAGRVLDPFSPGVEAKLDSVFAEKVAPHANNPLIIGYFLGNEQHFEMLPRVIPAYKGSKVAAKAKLIAMLREKYKDIDAFNKAWNVAKPFADFETASEEPLFIRTEIAAEDAQRFFRLYLEAYYSLVERVFRKHNPNHLLLGSRWTPGTANNKDVVEIGSRHVDVISINYYTYGIERAFLEQVGRWSGGKPLILSEWHYGTVEHGLTAHLEVKNDEERALAFRNYVEQAAAFPTVVGAQWFIYTDQAITGRFFQGFHGEGFNTGLVDVTDRPYRGLVEAAKLTHSRIYDIVLGKEPPFAFLDPRFNGSNAEINRRVAQAHRAATEVKLDGTTIGWPSSPATTIGSDRIVRGTPKPDLRGDFRLCWDESNLYFHITVKDQSPLRNRKEGGSIWQGDAVELFLGPKNLDKTGSPIFSDWHILIKAAEEPVIHVAEHPELSSSLKATVIPEVGGGGYAMALTIPWKTLDLRPVTGTELLFDVAIDNSDDGAMRHHQAVWNGTAGNSKDRGVWGRLTVVEN